MRLLRLLLIERIRRWLNLFFETLQGWGDVRRLWRFFTHILPVFFYWTFPLSSSYILFPYQYLSFFSSMFLSFLHPAADFSNFFPPPALSSCLPSMTIISCLPLSVFHLWVIIFSSRIGWKWIGSEGCWRGRKNKKERVRGMEKAERPLMEGDSNGKKRNKPIHISSKTVKKQTRNCSKWVR